MSKEFAVKTKHRGELVDITRQVQKAVSETRTAQGLAIVFVPHTTAGITIQENADPDVVRDFLWKLDQLVPRDDPAYHHSEGNSDAHMKASLVGSSVTVFVEDGRLMLGTWQGIYFCEFDGPRQRKLLIKCVTAEDESQPGARATG